MHSPAAHEETRPAMGVDAQISAAGSELTDPQAWRASAAVEEHDEKCVVDWRHEPRLAIANDYNRLHRPAYVINAAGGTDAGPSANWETRLPLDRADAKLDADGRWMTTEGVYQYPVFESTENDLGAIGGVGMRLYFFVVKSLGLLFLAFGVMSTPAIYTYNLGKMYDQPAASRFSDALGIRQSLGNIYATDADISAGAVGELWVASCTNAAISLCVIIFALWVGRQIDEIVLEVDKDTVTMSDYTVWISPVRDEQWSAFKVRPELNKERQRRKMISALTRAFGNAIPGAQFAQINSKPAIWVAWDEDEQIVLWRKKRALLMQLEASLKNYRSSVTAKQDTVLRKIEALNEELSQLNEGQAKKNWVPVAAFVTFESDDVYTRALQLKTLMVGGQKCNIGPAPEPDTLMWDHLEYSAQNRLVRSIVINCATILLLFGGAVAVSESNVLKERLGYIDQCLNVIGPLASELGNQGVCPDVLGNNSAMYRGAYDALTNVLPVKEFPRISKTAESRLPQQKLCTTTAGIDGSITWSGWAKNADGLSASCHRIDDAVPPVLWNGGDVDAMCYACVCSLASSDTTAPLNGSTSTSTTDGFCNLFHADKENAAKWGLVATILVNVVNQLLVKIVLVTSPWLKAHTKGEEMSSRSVRIFMCQLTNTAILVLLMKSSLGPFAEIPGEHYTNVNSKWYAYIASPMLLTMIIQFVTPPVMHLINHYGIRALIRAVKRFRATTQNQLNAAQAPIPRDFAAGYGEILLAMSVTLIYGPGIPVLYFVAAGGFGLRYWVEKWADLRIYEKPPLYSKALVSSFDEVSMVLALLHTAMSAYLVAVAGGTHPATAVDFTFNLRFRRPHVIPCASMFALSMLCVLYKTLAKISSLRGRLRRMPGGQFCISSEIIVDEELQPFSVVYKAGLLGNEDDDYYMDELEDLRDMQGAFTSELSSQHKLRPFDYDFYARMKTAINSDQQEESESSTSQGKWAKARRATLAVVKMQATGSGISMWDHVDGGKRGVTGYIVHTPNGPVLREFG